MWKRLAVAAGYVLYICLVVYVGWEEIKTTLATSYGAADKVAIWMALLIALPLLLGLVSRRK